MCQSSTVSGNGQLLCNRRHPARMPELPSRKTELYVCLVDIRQQCSRRHRQHLPGRRRGSSGRQRFSAGVGTDLVSDSLQISGNSLGLLVSPVSPNWNWQSQLARRPEPHHKSELNALRGSFVAGRLQSQFDSLIHRQVAP